MQTLGIVTFFKSYNYGVWLQAIATQRFFQNIGYDTEIINYTNILEGEKTKYAYKEGGKVQGYLTSFAKSLIFGKVRYYKKGFARYLNQYYRLSSKEYHNIQELQSIQYDILVAGSDQLWNPETTYGALDEAFLLKFGKAHKRISVATSIGSSPITEKDGQVIAEALSKFDAISVRERYASEQLHRFCDFPIQVIMDPTFLLSRDEWLKIAVENRNMNINDEKYILTYFISTEKRSERYYNMVRAYSKKLNLPVWAVQFSSARSTPYDRLILGASVSDFLNLIDHAALVLTDSFHGVALSVNLNSDFIAIQNTGNPERVRYLLENIGLLDRIEMPPESYSPIIYDHVNTKLEEIRECTINWVTDAAETEMR